MNLKIKNLRRIVLLSFIVLLMLNACFSAAKSRERLSIKVRARALDRDILAYGKIKIIGVKESIVNVRVNIVLYGPNGDLLASDQFIVSGSAEKGKAILNFIYTFEDCIKDGGIYTLKVTATYKGITATATFKFDPPTGGTPGLPF